MLERKERSKDKRLKDMLALLKGKNISHRGDKFEKIGPCPYTRDVGRLWRDQHLDKE
jgi:hypothetical protein